MRCRFQTQISQIFADFDKMKIKRTKTIIYPDKNRVLLRAFSPGDDQRIKKIISRILSLSKDELENELGTIMEEFSNRHRNLDKFYLNRYEQIQPFIDKRSSLNQNQKLLIGSYFTMEYSPESAALFNPSMVLHPDQTNLPGNDKRFILSLRATGEGHISSIIFTSGIIAEKNKIKLDDRMKYVTNAQKINDYFSTDDNLIYEIEYSKDVPLSERIIFPYSPFEVNGIEDARFVEFFNEDYSRTYYATYTAYDGKMIHPQILETKDFLHFKVNSLNGTEVRNKGMALFPKKINGKYAMLSRQDNENIYLMYSENLYTWDKKERIVEPKYPHEFVQLGNCGSPVETEEGWLVISHSVGAMRKYTISAYLFDKENPSVLIGSLNKPLISPDKNEREGYVPNVVYSCGGIVNNGELIIPYAMSDYACSFAKVNLNELLTNLK